MNNQVVKGLLEDFVADVSRGLISFHNEASLQMHLACFLKNKLMLTKYNVEVEVDINDAFKIEDYTTKCGKSKIDVVIFDGYDIEHSSEKYAIELKYPRNKQYPEQMFKFIQDIAFMEEAQGAWLFGCVKPFDGSFCLTFADDSNFYQWPPKDRTRLLIYNYFREPVQQIPHIVQEPCNSKNSKIPNQFIIEGHYPIKWLPVGNTSTSTLKYYLINIQKPMTLNCLISAIRLRRTGLNQVPQLPGCYRWWFRLDGATELLKNVPNIDWTKIQTININNQTYYALYFGETVNLLDRLKMHINGTVNGSTLRKTISALLGCVPGKDVNAFIDEYCYVDFEETESSEKAEEIETYELSQNYYPLNLDKNKVVDKNALKYISEKRAECAANREESKPEIKTQSKE